MLIAEKVGKDPVACIIDTVTTDGPELAGRGRRLLDVPDGHAVDGPGLLRDPG